MPVFATRNQISGRRALWDKAGTAGGEGAYTAGVLMHMMHDEHLRDRARHPRAVVGAWSANGSSSSWPELDQQVLHQYDKWDYRIIVEQEPGSGGKESAEATIRNSRRLRVFADKVTGSKVVRADPFAAQVQGGNVYLVAGTWVPEFIEEMEFFPSGKYKDQVDAAAGAFARLVHGPQFSLYSGWLGDDQ